MKSSLVLVETLKQALKTRRINYKTLGQKWNLSEASVKRIMSQGDLTVDRIEEACELMQLSFGDFIRMTPFQSESIDQELSQEAEDEFIKEPRLFHFWDLIYEGKSIKWIEKKFDVSPNESQKFLLLLDRIKLIELHPNSKVKVLAKNRIRFRKGGKMAKKIVADAKDSFLTGDFKNPEEHLRFGIYKMNPKSASRYKTKMDKLIIEMKSESELEGDQPESVEFGLLLALRPWTSQLLMALKPRKQLEG